VAWILCTKTYIDIILGGFQIGITRPLDMTCEYYKKELMGNFVIGGID